MSEGEDKDQKTEDASSRRLGEARKKGQVAQSREVTTWLSLSAAGIVVIFLAPGLARDLMRALTRFIELSHLITVDRTLGVALIGLVEDVGLSLAAPVLVIMAAGIAGPILQNGLVFAPERLRPKFSILSPASGLKRLFAPQGLIELAKSTLKVVVISWVCWLLLRSGLDRLEMQPSWDVASLGGEMQRLVTRMMIGVLLCVGALAAIDYVYQRFTFLKSMRMTKQEVKEEYKQTEGDPHIKGKLKQLRMQRSRRRMMAAVPTASVVVTNPTHFAVALKYDTENMAAPVVVAKGADLVAKRIREMAEQHGVPLVENPPLTRALYAAVEIDDEIPQEHYKAVAEIIGYVLRLRGKLPARRSAPG